MKNILIGCLVLLCSCQPEQQTTRPLRLNVFNEPPALDPRRARDITSETVLLMLYDGLTRLDNDGNATLALAQSYTQSADELTYTFTLRPAQWNNGDPVTSDDFVSAWTTILDPAFPAERPELLAILDSFSAPDPQTLVVELKTPFPHLPELVASPTFFPYNDGATNGPFEMHKHFPNHQIVVTKNPTYWDAENVYLPAIEMYTVEDANTELIMFEQGELDWVGGSLSCIPYDAIDRLRTAKLVHTQSVNRVYWYQFNANVTPFNHPKIRHAFSLAIDREQIVAHITRNTHRLPTGLLPTTTGTPLKHDPVQARQLLAEGLTELRLKTVPTVILSLNTGDDHLRIAQAVQQQWKSVLGVDVELRIADWQVHLDRISSGDYMVARYGRAAILPDVSDILSYFGQPIPQEMGYPAGVEEAARQLLDKMPAAPIFHISFNYLVNPQLTGVIFSPTSIIDFKSAHFSAGS